MIPVAFVQSLVTADSLQKYFPWLKTAFEEYPKASAVIMGYIPSLILAIFLAFLPMLCYGMPGWSRIRGPVTEEGGGGFLSFAAYLVSLTG